MMVLRFHTQSTSLHSPSSQGRRCAAADIPVRRLAHLRAIIDPSSKLTFSPSQPNGAYTPRTGPYQLMDYTTIPISCASVDLEVRPGDGVIYALGGVRTDDSLPVTFPGTMESLAEALAALDDLSHGVDALLGHNIIAHDLPSLAGREPFSPTPTTSRH